MQEEYERQIKNRNYRLQGFLSLAKKREGILRILYK